MPALPSSIIEPIWDQFRALIPPVVDTHPLGCHRPRVDERIVFDKLIQVLKWGIPYEGIADESCSATTIRRRRDEWIQAGIFEDLEDLCLKAADKMLGLQLEDLTVDGCIVKAPCGGEAAGRSPVDRGKQGTKRSLMVEGQGLPIGFVIAGANRPDSPLLEETLEQVARFGFDLPNEITVHLDAGYDSKKTRDLLDTLGCDCIISKKGEPLQAGKRWMVERTNSWHNRGFRKLQICTEKRIRVIDAFIRLANSVIITRQLIHRAWTTHRWDTRPTRKP
ncbi:IS5 family transposase [Bifidobacterium mongoliense]|uniref:IS5 family transposase n=2 Tax=Actinomycetes TaxID=1760 RepID=UPI002648CB6B|nr:IS5 family transposase [Bifidobacterium mongoliense]MDN6024980.1 IS5 family transposase [Bifidobacterium mongoliense]MDN6719940.1 IS5 family transposase [Bifidobacterium mongoliense]